VQFCLFPFSFSRYVLVMPKPMPVGTRFEFEQRVEFEHTLRKFQPELPPVLSTPQMIGWMEWACFLAAEPYCEGDETTVGTFYIFRVRAWDEHQEIGSGTVHRAFVSVSRFLKRVEAKKAGGR
jgi:predicted thioesterase